MLFGLLELKVSSFRVVLEIQIQLSWELLVIKKQFAFGTFHSKIQELEKVGLCEKVRHIECALTCEKQWLTCFIQETLT